MEKKNLAVLMVGGSGTRLWPLSRESYPKQFLDLDESGLTLFQKCIIRARKVSQDLLLIANFNHRFIILEQLRQMNLDSEYEKTINIIFEPQSKNTFPVAISAALFAKKNNFERILLLPSDQIIQNDGVFVSAVESADKFFDVNKSGILTFGITPTFPHTGYGYIEKTKNILDNSVFKVAKFTEKPNFEIADLYFKNKTHLWNCGMFYFSVDFFLKTSELLDKKTFDSVVMSLENGEKKHDFFVLNGEYFGKSASDSIDFAVMQKIDEVFCIELENSGWNDLGSFGQIYEISSKDENANSRTDNVYLQNVSNSQIINKTENAVALHGVDDLLVVAMKDVTVITKRTGNGNKEILDFLKNSTNLDCVKNQSFDHRPWGVYHNILERENFKIKIITVKPLGELSYQLHKKRSEHWIVVNGNGLVILNDKEVHLGKNESIYIHENAKHKIINQSATEDLVFVEVQCGSYFGEDDIIRIADIYGR